MKTAIPLDIFVLAFVYVFLYGAQALHAHYFGGEAVWMKPKLESSTALSLIFGVVLMIYLGVQTAWYEPIVLSVVSIGLYVTLRRVASFVGKRMYFMGGTARSIADFCFGNSCVPDGYSPRVGLATAFVSVFAFVGWPLTAFLMWRSIHALGPQAV